SGLGFEESSYEAAAAAGYAPTPVGEEPEDDEPVAPAAFAPAPALEQPYAAAAAPSADGGLFNMDALDSSLDALFSGLESGGSVPEAAEAPAAFEPAPEPAPVPAPVPAPIVAAPEPAKPAVPRPIVTESAPPKPVRPVATAPAAYPAAPQGLADLLPMATVPDLRGALEAVDRTPGVLGSLLVGHDGLIISTTLPPEMECDYLGAQASSLFAETNGQTRKMRRGDLRRMTLETANGVMLLMAADMGILVVVSQDGQAMDAASVTAAIAGALEA
ncbi:MAG: roadblock/LC7 domain-containing protein, partial [Candidatus Sericytochromatia bacterium]